MDKINFKDLPNTTTPINASNLNALQTNVEKVSIRKQSIPVSIGPVQGWYPVGSANLTGYDNASLTFLVEQVFGTGSAILKLNIRCNDGNNLLISEFCFTEITGGLNQRNFRLYLNGNNFYLYTNNDAEYGMINFILLNEKTLNSNLSYGIWNFDTPQYSETVSEPPIGDNVSVPYMSGPEIYRGVIHTTMEKRYASNASVTAYVPDGYNFLQWTYVASNGWVSAIYAASPHQVSTDLWNSGTFDNTTEQGGVDAYYLCIKLPVNS